MKLKTRNWSKRSDKRSEVLYSLSALLILVDVSAEMTEEEKAVIITDPELYDFVDKSTKFFQRALNDQYDVTFDYTAGAEYGG